MQAIKENKFVQAAPISFHTNKDEILAASRPIVQEIAKALQQAVWVKKIRVEGHTDDSGSNQANLDLSDRRAKNIMRLFEEYGVDPARMEAKGYGSSRPIADNDSEAGRAANHRVEIVIINPPQVMLAAEKTPVESPQKPKETTAENN